jgi:hypothetical protein
VYATPAQSLVEATDLELLGIRGDLDRQVVGHHRERLAVGAPQPLNGDDLVVLAEVELGGDLLVGDAAAVVEQLGRRILPGLREVVEEAGELDPAVHGILHDLRADAALSDQQTLVDDFLDGAPRRRARQREPARQRQLVLETVTGGQIAVADRRFDRLGELVVEGNRAGPVELNS